MTKACCSCKEFKSLDLFCKNKRSSDGLSAQCKLCAKQYAANNKDKKKQYPSSTKEYIKNYRDENKDQINLLRRENRTPDDAAKIREKYNSDIEYREKVKAYNRVWYSENKEYFVEKNKNYFDNNKDYIYLRNRKRDKKISEFANISQKDIDLLILNHNSKCFYCHVEVKRGINLHLDHKIPLSRDGEHVITNLVPSCKTCNLKKGTKTDFEFLNRI